MFSCEEREKTVAHLLETLERLQDPRYREGMARFAIPPHRAYGVPMPKLRKIARGMRKDHQLALRLWMVNTRETRLLASLLDLPHEVTEEQMDSWSMDFDNWEICDQVCQNLFVHTPWAKKKSEEWTFRAEEFVKRAGFALMAYLAVKDGEASDQVFERFLSLIEEHALDERKYVRQAVNWALCQIGKRNRSLHQKAIAVARGIREQNSPSTRFVAASALRELQSEGVLKRLEREG